MKKTIAEHMRDVLIDTDNPSVMHGDAGLLDDCGRRCAHTNLMKIHPLNRWQRILDALEHSPLFEKCMVYLGKRQGNQWVRNFDLKEKK